jgi:hypothetical protein
MKKSELERMIRQMVEEANNLKKFDMGDMISFSNESRDPNDPYSNLEFSNGRIHWSGRGSLTPEQTKVFLTKAYSNIRD